MTEAKEILKVARSLVADKRQVAQTILDQMGGTRRIAMMIGAKNFMSLNEKMGGVSFKFPRPQSGAPNYVKIVLNGKDLYDIEVGSIHSTKYKKLKSFRDIYAENLVRTFEKNTGLYLKF